jgi:hypothetical protein
MVGAAGLGIAGAAVAFGLYGEVVGFSLNGTAAALGADLRTAPFFLATQQMSASVRIQKKRIKPMKTTTITIGVQRVVESEESTVYWRRASRAMSEVVVLVIVVVSFLEMERTACAGELMSTAIGNEVVIRG